MKKTCRIKIHNNGDLNKICKNKNRNMKKKIY